MNKNMRKGFTTVELVIVIAVIAILATALIPTFGGLIDSANNTKYMSEAKQAFNDYMLADPAKASNATYYIKTTGNTYYKVSEGKLSTDPVDADAGTKGIQNPTLACTDVVLTVQKNGTYTEGIGAEHTWDTTVASGDNCGVTGDHYHCTVSGCNATKTN